MTFDHNAKKMILTCFFFHCMVTNTNILRFEILAYTLILEADLVLPKVAIRDLVPFFQLSPV